MPGTVDLSLPRAHALTMGTALAEYAPNDRTRDRHHRHLQDADHGRTQATPQLEPKAFSPQYLRIPQVLAVDPPGPVAEQGPVNGQCTEGSDYEDREQGPHRCSVHAFEGSPPNRHSLEALMLWRHKAPLCRSYRQLYADAATRPTIQRSRTIMGMVSGALRLDSESNRQVTYEKQELPGQRKRTCEKQEQRG
jgi:hypothetical protein